MKKIFMLLSVMFVALTASAQTDHIEVAPLKLLPGEEGKLCISLINTERDYTQFYLDVELPECLSFNQYKVGRNNVWGEVSADRSNGHSLTSAQPGDNPLVRRYLVESGQNLPFYNDDENGNPVSEILYVGIKIDENAEPGDYSVKVTKINFTALEENKGVNYVFEDASTVVTVESLTQEDFNVSTDEELADFIEENKAFFGETVVLNLEEGDYTMTKAVEIPAGTAVMVAGNGATLTLSEGANFVANGGLVLEGLTIDAADLGNNALIQMGAEPVKTVLEPAEYDEEGNEVTPEKRANGQIVDIVAIKNVTINNVPSYIYSDGGKPWIINDFSIDNSVIKLNTTDEALKGQALIRANGYGIVSNVITESTIYNVGEADAAAKYLIQYNNSARADRMNAEMAYVILRNNTMYNTWSAGGQIANYSGIAGKNTTTLTMTDNIFVGMPDVARRFVGGNNGSAIITFENNTYEKADGTFDDASNYDKSGTAIESDPMFANAANGDFTVAVGSLQAKFQTGDPRWLVEYDPTDPTAIDNAIVENASNGVIFNLAGQKVSENYKGIVIKNGKKAVIK